MSSLANYYEPRFRTAAFTAYPVNTLENFDASSFDQEVDAGGPRPDQNRVDRAARRAYASIARAVGARIAERFPELDTAHASFAAKRAAKRLVDTGQIDAVARPEAPARAAEVLSRISRCAQSGS